MTSIKELMSLRGRRSLITGATGFLGQTMADTLAELGSNLLLVDRPGCDFVPLENELRKRWKVKTKSVECDLENEDQRNTMIESVKNDGKGLNILINNAAFAGSSNLEGWSVPFEKQTLSQWRRAMEVNLAAVFHLCQGFAPVLGATKGGNIINICSIYGVCAPDWKIYKDTNMGNPAAYATSKGGLIQFSRWLATTLAPNVRVNAITPGGIFRNQPSEFVERYEYKTPLQRMATEDDFRGAVAFLSSDLSVYVTGQNLMIDGGFTIW